MCHPNVPFAQDASAPRLVAEPADQRCVLPRRQMERGYDGACTQRGLAHCSRLTAPTRRQLQPGTTAAGTTGVTPGGATTATTATAGRAPAVEIARPSVAAAKARTAVAGAATTDSMVRDCVVGGEQQLLRGAASAKAAACANPNAAVRAPQALMTTTGGDVTATAGADGECPLGARLVATSLTLLPSPCGKQPR